MFINPDPAEICVFPSLQSAHAAMRDLHVAHPGEYACVLQGEADALIVSVYLPWDGPVRGALAGYLSEVAP